MNVSLLSIKTTPNDLVLSKIKQVVSDYIAHNISFICITDLNTEYDRYFASLCQQAKLPIHVYLPHDNICHLYKTVPTVKDQIEKLVDYADKVEKIHGGAYSPKKHIKTSNFIIDKSDVVIVVHHSRLIINVPPNKTTINIYDEKDKTSLSS